MSETSIQTAEPHPTCGSPWDDPGHRDVAAEYLLQTHARIRNRADPITVCARCVAELRASIPTAIAWVRSLRHGYGRAHG